MKTYAEILMVAIVDLQTLLQEIPAENRQEKFFKSQISETIGILNRRIDRMEAVRKSSQIII